MHDAHDEAGVGVKTEYATPTSLRAQADFPLFSSWSHHWHHWDEGECLSLATLGSRE